MTRTLLATALGLLLAGCSLAPDYQRPATPAGASWQASQDQQTTRGWKATFSDPALQELINQALANNRDLRIAALNVQIDRKVLADMAVNDEAAFAELVAQAKNALESKKAQQPAA